MFHSVSGDSMAWLRRPSKLKQLGLVLIAIGLAILAVLLPLLGLRASDHCRSQIVEFANILAFSVAALGGALMLAEQISTSRLVSPQSLDDAVNRLVTQVRIRTDQQFVQLLGTGIATMSTADLCFQPSVVPEPADDTDSDFDRTLKSIGRYYTEHARQRRLVILGDAGAGKTVLALVLLTQILDQRVMQTDRHHQSVPVHFSLSTWDSSLSLNAWLASQIATQFGMSDKLASALVAGYRILPILDGLDEMDPPCGAPDRAVAVINQLNVYLHGLTDAPVVVTCRTDRYQRLRDPVGAVVRRATEITIQPLTVEQIRDCLDNEYEFSVGSPHRKSWDPILTVLDESPDPRPLLALRTPWQLALAISYHCDGGDLYALLPDPTEPLRPSGSDDAVDDDPYPRRIGALLLSRFIQARTHLDPSRRHTPIEVTRWCRVTAQHLGGRCDIILHEWWPIAGTNRVRRWHSIAAVIIVVTMVFLADAASVHYGDSTGTVAQLIRVFHPNPKPTDYVNAIWDLLFIFGAIGMTVRQARKTEIRPTRANLRQLRTRPGIYQFTRWLVIGSAIGAMPGTLFGLAAMLTTRDLKSLSVGLAYALAFGLALGLPFALAFGLKPVGEVTTYPRDPLRDDLTIWLAVGVATALGYSLPFGLVLHPDPGLVMGLAGKFAFGLPVGLASGLAFGLAGHAWLRYTVAMTIMAGRSHLPWRYGRFLRWAHKNGLVRVAGNAYQFRHAELRDWLREHPADTRITR